MTQIFIRLNGEGGELDHIVLPRNADEDTIQRAVIQLARRCTFAVGDTITITEED